VFSVKEEAVELRTRESLDVKPYLQNLEFEKINVDFPAEFQEIKHVLRELFNRYVDEMKYRGVLYGNSSKIALIEYISVFRLLYGHPRKPLVLFTS